MIGKLPCTYMFDHDVVTINYNIFLNIHNSISRSEGNTVKT